MALQLVRAVMNGTVTTRKRMLAVSPFDTTVEEEHVEECGDVDVAASKVQRLHVGDDEAGGDETETNSFPQPTPIGMVTDTMKSLCFAHPTLVDVVLPCCKKPHVAVCVHGNTLLLLDVDKIAEEGLEAQERHDGVTVVQGPLRMRKATDASTALVSAVNATSLAVMQPMTKANVGRQGKLRDGVYVEGVTTGEAWTGTCRHAMVTEARCDRDLLLEHSWSHVPALNDGVEARSEGKLDEQGDDGGGDSGPPSSSISLKGRWTVIVPVGVTHAAGGALFVKARAQQAVGMLAQRVSRFPPPQPTFDTLKVVYLRARTGGAVSTVVALLRLRSLWGATKVCMGESGDLVDDEHLSRILLAGGEGPESGAGHASDALVRRRDTAGAGAGAGGALFSSTGVIKTLLPDGGGFDEQLVIHRGHVVSAYFIGDSPASVAAAVAEYKTGGQRMVSQMSVHNGAAVPFQYEVGCDVVEPACGERGMNGCAKGIHVHTSARAALDRARAMSIFAVDKDGNAPSNALTTHGGECMVDVTGVDVTDDAIDVWYPWNTYQISTTVCTTCGLDVKGTAARLWRVMGCGHVVCGACAALIKETPTCTYCHQEYTRVESFVGWE